MIKINHENQNLWVKCSQIEQDLTTSRNSYQALEKSLNQIKDQFSETSQVPTLNNTSNSISFESNLSPWWIYFEPSPGISPEKIGSLAVLEDKED